MHSDISYSVGILAGGKSTRMGENKAFLSLNGKTFVEGLIEEFRGLDVMISVASDTNLHKSMSYVNHPRLIPDMRQDVGPLEGFYQLLSHAKEDYVFICAVDMPFLKKEAADLLASCFHENMDCICLKDDEHVHPMCAIYSVRTVETLKALLSSGHRRVLDFLDAILTEYIPVEETCLSKQMLRNINTKEEYCEAAMRADS